MQIYVNDKPIQCKDNITVTVLLEQLQQLSPGMALALNEKIMPHEQWTFQQIHDGDHILLFQVIAGG